MKKIHSFLLITLVAIVSSCSKDPIISNHNQVGISKVTYYVNITLTGASSISVIQGSPFTDPGVKGNAGGVDVPVITTGTVDVSTPGSYTLSYSATNSDGFSSAATRTVYVIPSAELPGVDLSGDYMTTGGTPDATITKVAPGVYTTTNCWGNGSAAIIPAYFFCTDGATVTIPLQNGPAGHIQTTMPGTYVNGLISWQIIRLDFAPPLTRDKTWQKL
jgi:Domain of unknown function (DUF5011)/Prokaryotic membrane lipoprotein lipid attachment site